mmetsp:Transcript_23507/g.81455  ORF Transcript_23507/g.81455 Transcript_23507/m.81455 type:complete len:147 (-) Transcript_23507:600-1040(-)
MFNRAAALVLASLALAGVAGSLSLRSGRAMQHAQPRRPMSLAAWTAVTAAPLNAATLNGAATPGGAPPPGPAQKLLRALGESTRFVVSGSVAVTLLARRDAATFLWVVRCSASEVPRVGLATLRRTWKPRGRPLAFGDCGLATGIR